MQEPETKKSRAADCHTAQVYGRNKSQNPLFQGFFENADGVLGADIAGTVAERIVIYVRNLCSGGLLFLQKTRHHDLRSLEAGLTRFRSPLVADGSNQKWAISGGRV